MLSETNRRISNHPGRNQELGSVIYALAPLDREHSCLSCWLQSTVVCDWLTQWKHHCRASHVPQPSFSESLHHSHREFWHNTCPAAEHTNSCQRISHVNMVNCSIGLTVNGLWPIQGKRKAIPSCRAAPATYASEMMPCSCQKLHKHLSAYLVRGFDKTLTFYFMLYVVLLSIEHKNSHSQ